MLDMTANGALLSHASQGFNGEWYIYLFRFVLLFSYIIPISLRVNLDLGKTYCSRQMQHGMDSLSRFVIGSGYSPG